jgi:hypothetical protein
MAYDDSTNTVFLHDTWDNDEHSMPWGGTYSGMVMQSVSIVNIDPHGPFAKTSPSNTSTVTTTTPTLTWEPSNTAVSYETCLTTTAGLTTTCDTSWTPTTTTSFTPVDPLTNGATYYWQVRAINPFGTTIATNDWWSFTVNLPTAVLVTGFSSTMASPAGLQVSWESAEETNTLGYDLYRSELPGEIYTKINPTPILAKSPGQLVGNSYTYLDSTAKPGVRYSYELVHIDIHQNNLDLGKTEGVYYQSRLPVILR